MRRVFAWAALAAACALFARAAASEPGVEAPKAEALEAALEVRSGEDEQQQQQQQHSFLDNLVNRVLAESGMEKGGEQSQVSARSAGQELTLIERAGFNASDLALVIASSTPTPYFQLTAVRELDADERPQANSSSQESSEEQPVEERRLASDDDDRHIQYDMVHAAPSEARHLKLHARDADNAEAADQAPAETQKPANASEPTAPANETTLEPPTAKRAVRTREASDRAEAQWPAESQLVEASEQPASPNATASQAQQQVAPRAIQARAMSALSATSSAGSRAPAHTRPPYATYDQFQHRSQPTAPSLEAPGASNGSAEAAQQLATSLGRISSQLASSEAKQQAQLANNNNNSAERQPSAAQLVGQLLELSPLPADAEAPPGGGQQQHPLEGAQAQERFNAQKDSQLLSFFPSLQDRKDRFQFGDEPLSNAAPKSALADDRQQQAQQHELERRNAGNQLGANELEPFQTHTSLVERDLQQESSLFLHQMAQQQQQQQHLVPAGRTHHAASLVNVTAPLILPLSATEAMESSLQALPALGRPLSSGSAGGGRVSAQASHYMSHEPPLMQPLYSQPANLFSPKPPAVPSGHAQAAAGGTDLSGAEQSANASFLEERTRLNRNNGYFLAGRRPAGASSMLGFGPQSSSGPSNGSSSAAPAAAAAPSTASPPQQTAATPQHQASGFRSPAGLQSAASYASASSVQPPSVWPSRRMPLLSSYLNSALIAGLTGGAASGSPQVSVTPSGGPSSTFSSESRSPGGAGERGGGVATSTESMLASLGAASPATISAAQTRAPYTGLPAPAANGSFLAGHQPVGGEAIPSSAAAAQAQASGSGGGAGGGRPAFNLTRVEHISAECSNDLIRTVIVFNGTFKGIIYSSGYVRDSNCVYVNGTGKTRYDFSIRLNQCGTLNRAEEHLPSRHNEVRRRDQVMWNTLSIQYNPIIEQEWDEHFRVSCEYGSDFWKTVAFSPFSVETNTGAPIAFSIEPPRCQMEILRGHGMVGPRQDAVSGPVTVGDPLTLLIHMTAEKTGYDILVKNCYAHNGQHQKMALIDSNGCVVNERFISPFRGTYNDHELKQVTLYSYLKAFRFTGTPVLYLECQVHMCQSACPPQMCYWRRLSKRSANHTHLPDASDGHAHAAAATELGPADSGEAEAEQLQHFETWRAELPLPSAGDSLSQVASTTLRPGAHRQNRRLSFREDEEGGGGDTPTRTTKSSAAGQRRLPEEPKYGGQISAMTTALEVREARDPDASGAPRPLAESASYEFERAPPEGAPSGPLMCYRRAEVLAYLFTGCLLLLVAVSATLGCCWRAASLKGAARRKRLAAGCLSSANSSGACSPIGSANQSTLSANSYAPRLRAANSPAHTQAQLSAYHRALNAMGPIWHCSARHKTRAPF